MALTILCLSFLFFLVIGVPVAFAEISRVTALCEVIEMREGLVPDVSLGTHFFNDLVEAQILYLVLVPGDAGNVVSDDILTSLPNRLTELLPDEAAWADVVRVIDSAVVPPVRAMCLHVDALRQSALCYFG
jgi:hypothetical protein